MNGNLLLALALLTAGVAGSACSPTPPRPRNAILITVDTLRADHLSAYGYTASRTPNMDRIGREGVRFATAYCDIPWTTGSVASTMTGTFGPRHGVQSFTNRLADDQTTLAELFKKAGYTTGAIVASFALDSAFHLDQGFDSYDDRFDKPVFAVPGELVGRVDLETTPTDVSEDGFFQKLRNDAYRDDDEVTAAATLWIEEHHDEPFFLWVHFFGPHERLTVDKGSPLSDRVIADYDPNTRATDIAIGRLLDNLEKSVGLAARTLVVLHSDHGQALREHGIFGHGHDLYEESVRVPLMMRLPGEIAPGVVVKTIARNVDIGSTLLDFLEIPIPGGLDGRSLRPAIRGEVMADAPAYMEVLHGERLPVKMPPLGEYFGESQWHGVRIGEWKYLRVQMTGPCVHNPTRYEQGMMGTNPKNAFGGEKLLDTECAKPVRQDLYQSQSDNYVKETFATSQIAQSPREAAERADIVRQISTSTGYRTALPLNDGQKNKLKSLGYLQ